MAHLRRHPESPYWYLRRRDLDTGRWTEQTTGLRADDAMQTRKAQRMAQAASKEEKQIGNHSPRNPAFRVWVPEFIQSHGSRKAAGTWKRMQIMWSAVKAFLASEGIMYPREVRYEHAQDYLRWRIATRVHERSVCRNTALAEMKFFSQILNESRRRDYIQSNPFTHLGFPREAPKVKPELSDEEIKTLLNAARTEPAWIGRAIRIATYTGCRFSECAIESSRIDIKNRTITIIDAKRDQADPRKLFTIPMPDELVPTFVEMQRNKETVTCRLSGDKNGRINKFFRKCGV